MHKSALSPHALVAVPCYSINFWQACGVNICDNRYLIEGLSWCLSGLSDPVSVLSAMVSALSALKSASKVIVDQMLSLCNCITTN